MSLLVNEKINKLRKEMKKEGIACYIIPSSDAHNSEYVGEHDQIRKWFTGFTGSNGSLIVTPKEARLWTDGRYFIQCEQEIAGSEIIMMKMGEKDVPTISEYIADLNFDKLAFDGRVLSKAIVDELLSKSNIELSYRRDIAGEIWEECDQRPKRPANRVKLLDINFTGKDFNEKIKEVRDIMAFNKCEQLFISKLDDIMWLFNIRGNDVECNPVALSYAFITMSEAFIFIQGEALSPAVRGYFQEKRIIVCDYNDVYDFLRDYPYSEKTMLDNNEISFSAYEAIKEGYGSDFEINDGSIVDMLNPTSSLKAVKNEIEIKHMKEYFLRDSLAMTRYIYWLKVRAREMEAGGKLLTELEAASKCDELRLSVMGCSGLSFPTIAAYGANAAMMHYEATSKSYSFCEPGKMLLTDCGGQYPAATTDVTRTVAIGRVSEDEIHDFTLVLKGFLRLMKAKWIYGCSGRNLDILARGPLWAEGKDYKCGTGHGVGCNLNVHEGPQSIRWKYIKGKEEAILKAGMTITDEPGVYIEGRYGIRTENTLLVVEDKKTSDGSFLCFENLTWVPIDISLVDRSLLTENELNMLKDYQNTVYLKLKDMLLDEERKWLKEQTEI